MGCGSSTPAGTEGKLKVDTGKNAVQAMTPTSSPKSKTKKETLADEPMPEASTYTTASPKTAESKDDDSTISISSYGSPVDTHRTHQQDPLDPYSSNLAGGKLLSPGYKMENETRRIGGFDPEAFRKANQQKNANQGSSQQWSSGQWNNESNSWSNNNTQQREQPNRNANNGNNHNSTWVSPAAAATTYGGGSGSGAATTHDGRGSDARETDRWNKGDYIQSQDIFTTDSRQAMEPQQRMDIMDPHHDIMGVSSSHDDPFRSPGGMGHQPTHGHGGGHHKVVDDDDDALMDDILGELDEI